jgi:hypothetical protein
VNENPANLNNLLYKLQPTRRLRARQTLWNGRPTATQKL